MKTLLFPLILIPTMSQAADLTAEKTVADGIEIVRLRDVPRQIEVSIVPSIGNNSYQMRVRGQPVFWNPYSSLAEFQAKPIQLGNPFLAPWANRIDQLAYWVNGKKFLLNPELKNFRLDQSQQPIHGLLVTASEWKVVSVRADRQCAEATSRLEFWRYPEWMAQFPFAHTIEMTYRLADGALEVETKLENHSTAPMPVAIGYHPYFKVPDAPRDEWVVHLAARERMTLSPALTPTGERRPADLPDTAPLANTRLDDVFTGLVRDSAGKAEFWVRGKRQQISVIYGPKYPVAIVYAPAGRDFICFEPMAAATNAFNLAHSGRYSELQSIPPGGVWRESFWVRPSGY